MGLISKGGAPDISSSVVIAGELHHSQQPQRELKVKAAVFHKEAPQIQFALLIGCKERNLERSTNNQFVRLDRSTHSFKKKKNQLT